MNTIICKDYQEMSQKAANLAAEYVKQYPEGLFSFPGGDTPLGFMHTFSDMVNQGVIDISKAKYVSLDEWVGLSASDPGSCGHFNHENLLIRMSKSFLETHIIDGAAKNMDQEKRALDAFIAANGPICLSVLGIGLNGHLGFNESGIDPTQNSHIIPLADITKTVMKKYFGDNFSPEFGITQGLNQILRASGVIVIASGRSKAEIIQKTIQGPISRDVPASLLRNHPNCFFILDEEAASML